MADNVTCSDSGTFSICYSNWQATGSIEVCAGWNKNTQKYNECLCKQYFGQAYCYSNFCPQDPNTAQLNTLQSQYCALVPSFDPNPIATTALILAQAPVTPSGAINGTSTPGTTLTGIPMALGSAAGSQSAHMFLLCLVWVLVLSRDM
ncbi:hypothetical protein BC830DRAFT_477264 [Chytriomyces sp. MP71]|nr:hypothetical protein BC830DRAFT_477264 [Chytriomyces sp. MP71]